KRLGYHPGTIEMSKRRVDDMLCLFKRGFKGIEVAASAAFSTSPSPSAVQSILSLRPRAQYSHHSHILRIAFAMEPEDRPFGLFVLPRFGAKARRQHESAKAGAFASARDTCAAWEGRTVYGRLCPTSDFTR